jgi:hypothetical protein
MANKLVWFGYRPRIRSSWITAAVNWTPIISLSLTISVNYGVPSITSSKPPEKVNLKAVAMQYEKTGSATIQD